MTNIFRSIHRFYSNRIGFKWFIARKNLKFLGVKSVSLENLHVTNSPKCMLNPTLYSGDSNPCEFLVDYYTDGDGKIDMHIGRSVHYKLIKAYEEGKLCDYKKTDYWRMQVNYREMGIGKRPDEWIENKIDRVLESYRSIRDNGYHIKDELFYDYITVLERPRLAAIFGHDYEIDGFEILGGNHRCACLKVLGYKKVDVVLLRAFPLA